MSSGPLDSAIDALTNAISDRPQDMRARRQRSIAYYRARKFKESLADAEYVLKQPRLPRFFKGWAEQHCWSIYRATADKKPALNLVTAYSKDPVKRAAAYVLIVPEVGAETVLAALDQEIENTRGKCPELIFSRASVNLTRGQRQLAINDWKRVANSPVSGLSDIMARAHAYQLLNQFDRAVSMCDQAIALDDKYCWCFEFRGLFRSFQGRWKEAEADYTRALTLDPSDIESYRGRANARLKLGDLNGALDDSANLLQLDQPSAYVLRAQIYERKGEMKNALTAISVVAKNNDQQVLLVRNDLLTKAILQGIVDEKNIRQYLDPQHLGDTAILLGGAYLANNAKKYKAAMIIADDVLAEEPLSVGALLQKAYAAAGIGDEKQAISCCKKALALKHSSHQEVVATEVKSMLLERQGKKSEILVLWTKLIQKYPNEAAAYYSRASEYRRQKQYQNALVDSERAIRLNPRPLLYWCLRIELKVLEDKPPEEIVKSCTEAIARFPDNQWLYEIRAQTYQKLGDDDHELKDRDRLKRLRMRK